MTLPTSPSELPVTLGADQRADFAALPTEALRRAALRYLTRLKTTPRLGKRLRDHPTMGDLADCRKIYFDERDDVPPRWRIVYRLVPDAEHPRSVEVISIGKRAHASAYVLAARRLRRMR